MFAYCLNNPLNLVDYSGNYPQHHFFDSPAAKFGYKVGEWLGNLLRDNYNKKRNEAKSIPYHSMGIDRGAQILESHTVKNPFIMYEYLHKNRGDEVAGSTTGIVFEWIVHNAAYAAGEAASFVGFTDFGYNLKEKGRTLDIGRTIYDDSHGVFSWAMWGGYALLSPATAIYDLYIKVFE